MSVNLTLTVGQVETFNDVTFDDASGNPITAETPAQLGITFSNSNPSVASIAFDGTQVLTVTALAAGSTVINALANGQNLQNPLQVTVQSAGAVSVNWGNGSPVAPTNG